VNALQSQLQSLSPDHIVLQGSGDNLRAADLLTQVGLLAEMLRSRSAQTVALFADNSPEWVIVDLACQWESITLVPIPTFFSEGQIQHLLATASVDTLLYDAQLKDQVARWSQGMCFDIPSANGLCAVTIPKDVDSCRPPSTHKITFTSGSTGQPKGVCLSSAQCVQVAQSLAELIEIDHPRHLCLLPLSTLLENIAGVYLPLMLGGLCIAPPLTTVGMLGSSGVHVASLLDSLECYQPDTVILVPQLLAVFDQAISNGWQPPASLKFVAVGGGHVPEALLHRVREAGMPVYEGYGLSESGSVVSLNTPKADRPGSCGQVLSHARVIERGGELLVSGNTFLGYLNDKSSWGQEQFSTGDLGRIDSEGFVSVTGRCKNVLVSSFGRNISPEWLESELQATGYISQAVVVGDGRPFCTALLWEGGGKQSNAALQQLVANVNQTLPDYAQIKDWRRLPEPLDTNSGMLTENGRYRRSVISKHYSATIETMYSEFKEMEIR